MSGGIFHSLKKTLGSKGDARPDGEFVEVKSRFDQYQDTCVKLKGNIQSYLAHANSIYVTSSQIAQDFSTLLEDPDVKNKSDYSPTVVSSRQEHSSIAQDFVPRLTQTFQTQLLAPLDEEIVRNAELAKRIARRIELWEEFGYYQRKVNELRDEKDKRACKGKAESASDIEKLERNLKKLNEMQLTYNDCHAKLLADLSKLWETDRIKAIGPILNKFLAQEKIIANNYADMLKTITTNEAK